MSKISAIVIGIDEESKIADCIKSLAFADEILFFDNGSTDKTKEIAKENGAIIYQLQGGDFSSRKNDSFKKAKNEWILSLDADERITTELKHEIALRLNKEHQVHYSALAIPRKNIILGKEFKHGGEWPDYVIRLFKKSEFIKMEGKLHEQPKFKGKLGYLKNPILHIKHENLSEMLQKTNEWSSVEANLMYDGKHPRMNILRFISAGFREFWSRMIIKKGFLDGTEGVIYSLYQVVSRLISYMKLWEMQIKSDTKSS